MGNPLITISFLLVGLASGAAAGVLLYRSLLHDRPKGRRRCPKCWYDMRGSPTLICPECGHDAKTEKRLLKTRRSRKGMIAAFALVAIALYLQPVHRRMVRGERLWEAAIPTTVVATAYGYGSAEFRTQCFDRFDPPVTVELIAK